MGLLFSAWFAGFLFSRMLSTTTSANKMGLFFCSVCWLLVSRMLSTTTSEPCRKKTHFVSASCRAQHPGKQEGRVWGQWGAHGLVGLGLGLGLRTDSVRSPVGPYERA